MQYNLSVDEKALFERLDKIIDLLDVGLKPVSKVERVIAWIAAVIGIMGILAIVDIIISWLGG